ncbi:hypothetical protein D0463_05230 [Bacillus sp. V59.32b]|nr:hypothetical protein D0463_05230 [Bacillus sp. V59.32b]
MANVDASPFWASPTSIRRSLPAGEGQEEHLPLMTSRGWAAYARHQYMLKILYFLIHKKEEREHESFPLFFL